MPLFDARYDSLSSTDACAVQNPDDRIDELLAGLWPENGDFTNHQLPAGGEQLTGAGPAVGTERVRPEAGRRQMNGARVAVRIACNLTEDPVAPGQRRPRRRQDAASPETDPRMGTERGLSRRLKVRPRRVFLGPAPICEDRLAQQRGLLAPWCIVENGHERPTRSRKVDVFQEPNLAARVDDSFNCSDHYSSPRLHGTAELDWPWCGERDVSAAARPARCRLHAFVRRPLRQDAMLHLVQ